MVTTLLLCLFAIALLSILAVSIAWPIILGAVITVILYKVIMHFVKKEENKEIK